MAVEHNNESTAVTVLLSLVSLTECVSEREGGIEKERERKRAKRYGSRFFFKAMRVYGKREPLAGSRTPGTAVLFTHGDVHSVTVISCAFLFALLISSRVLFCRLILFSYTHHFSLPFLISFSSLLGMEEEEKGAVVDSYPYRRGPLTIIDPAWTAGTSQLQQAKETFSSRIFEEASAPLSIFPTVFLCSSCPI